MIRRIMLIPEKAAAGGSRVAFVIFLLLCE